VSHASLNKLPRLTPELKREMNHLLTDLRYVLECIATREQALAFREVLNTPLAEFEKKWGIRKEAKNG
jgi:hypothetical protein